MRTGLTAALICAAAMTSAGELPFEADPESHFVRCMPGLTDMAKCEMIMPTTPGDIVCLALDGEGQPLAIGRGYRQTGNAWFNDMDPARIADVLCRVHPDD